MIVFMKRDDDEEKNDDDDINCTFSLSYTKFNWIPSACVSCLEIMKYFSKLNFDPSSWLLSPFFTEL